ncbi:hypothetical protein ATI61_115153 [Archangium gephyra]|uniref:DUF4845 domain-containing protein n=1 Tax=Archangium gephyra TaxID=48 RepID=A0AAC8Q9Q2_9BACT|nr:hypothetical protein [Archangium gephyra]AKJ03380.1 Hypothetical protein AA314_05006 [Archangium gephyra]REG24111.1 hypothetical protein ATI61_115153 [Archangium gephyra]
MRHPSGKISFGGLVLLILVAGGIYLGAMLVPFYVDNLDVKEAVTAAFNRSPTADDDSLRRLIIERTGQMGSHWETDQFDQDILVPGLGLTADNITIERSSVSPEVRVEVEYTRRVRFKPTQHVRVLRFHVVKEGIPGK